MKIKQAFHCIPAFCFLAAPIARAEVKPVPSVDLSRYLGTWYEIASIPHSFQKQCVGNTRADYSEADDATIKVLNSCEEADGSRSDAEGRARVVDTTSNAKLEVTFVRIFGRWIYLFGGDYWVIDLEPNYKYAVVGHPDRSYGWILSRTPSLANTDLNQIAANLKTQGYDLCEFKMTRQKDGFQNEPVSLCDYLKSL